MVVSKLPVVITSPAAAQQQPTLVPAPGSGSSLISDHTTRGLGTPSTSTSHYVPHHQPSGPHTSSRAVSECSVAVSDASTPPSTGPSQPARNCKLRFLGSQIRNTAVPCSALGQSEWKSCIGMVLILIFSEISK